MSAGRPCARLVVAAAAAGLTLAGAAGAAQPGKKGPVFEGSRAFDHVRELVAIGPRTPGSRGSAEARAYIIRQLKAMGLSPVEQSFVAQTPLGPIRMTNVVATVPGKGPGRLVLGGHYDTKIFREFRFVGANDGGSSTAVLLEMARALSKRRNALPVDVVFFDGEEATVEWVNNDHTYGSRHYVAEAARAGTLGAIRAMVLVDMVGDRDLDIRRETQSTPWLTDIIWAAARKAGHGAHFLDESEAVMDDHVEFLRAGVPAVNIIDYRYGPWHTPDDTLDKVSARSLETVGETLLTAWPALEAAARTRARTSP